MWQDYDYHQNTGELPEYFEDDNDEPCYENDEGGDPGPDYIPIRSKCPRCGCMSAKLLVDGTYSCLYCSTNFYDGRIIRHIVQQEAEEVEDEVVEEEAKEALVPLYCIKCGSDNTEYYDNNTFHCLDCYCITHPGASCPKCRRRFMSLLPDNTWECLSCGAKFTDEVAVGDLHFKCYLYNIRHLAEFNQEALVKKYSKKAQLNKQPTSKSKKSKR